MRWPFCKSNYGMTFTDEGIHAPVEPLPGTHGYDTVQQCLVCGAGGESGLQCDALYI